MHFAEKEKRKNDTRGHVSEWLYDLRFTTADTFRRIGSTLSKHWSLIVLAVFFCALVSPVVGFVWLLRDDNFTCFNTPFPSTVDIESAAFLKLPPSAENFEYTADRGGSSCTVLVTFDMAPDDLEIFRESTLVDSLDPIRLKEEIVLYLLKNQGWKQPLSSLAGTGRYEGYYPYVYQQVFVETTNPNQFSVTLVTDQDWIDCDRDHH